MENEAVIRKQMEETRTSLTEKLETLEEKVASTVQQTASAVNETVATVKETVHEGVEAVHETVSSVKEGVHDSVESVKDFLDINARVEENPWLMLGGAVATGFALGLLTAKPSTPSGFPASLSSSGRPPSNGWQDQRPQETSASSTTGKSEWLSLLEPALGKLKNLALGAALGTVREMVVAESPPAIGQHLRDIIDDITKKVGGDTLPSSDFENCPLTGSNKRWEELRDRTKARWQHIPDDELNRTRGDVDQLIDIVRQRTGQTREQIEQALQLA